MNEKAKLLANLFCLMRGSNAAFAKQFLGVWLYRDGIVVHNLEAAVNENAKRHLELFTKKIAMKNMSIREFDRCDCEQCWAMILQGRREEAIRIRSIVWESAFESAGLPTTPPSPLEHGLMPPDLPTITEHAAFIQGLQKHGLLRCCRMVKEGQRRTFISPRAK